MWWFQPDLVTRGVQIHGDALKSGCEAAVAACRPGTPPTLAIMTVQAFKLFLVQVCRVILIEVAHRAVCSGIVIYESSIVPVSGYTLAANTGGMRLVIDENCIACDRPYTQLKKDGLNRVAHTTARPQDTHVAC
jgi:hypothetical protein